MDTLEAQKEALLARLREIDTERYGVAKRVEILEKAIKALAELDQRGASLPPPVEPKPPVKGEVPQHMGPRIKHRHPAHNAFFRVAKSLKGAAEKIGVPYQTLRAYTVPRSDPGHRSVPRTLVNSLAKAPWNVPTDVWQDVNENA